jgi:Zn-dependent protease/predicted transcriptional regulator
MNGMKSGSFRFARIAGIDLSLHYTWIIIAILIVISLVAQFRYTNPDWSTATVWGSAIITGLLFFAGLILHELSHAVVARARGLPVNRITLFLLGGVAQIEREPQSASTEFLMAIAGPLMSVAFGFICLAIAHFAFGWSLWTLAHNPGAAIFEWLGYINFLLAAFNMIPGFPLDGGRVLRSILWWITGNADRATRIAASIGQVVGWLFIIYGIFRLFTGEGIGAIWLAIIGWFLIQAAGSSLAVRQTESALAGLKVSDAMSRNCGTIPSNISLQDFVDSYLLRTGERCFVVQDQGYLIGMITPHEVRQVPREDWTRTSVRAAMLPMSKMRTLAPDTPLFQALEDMTRQDINQMPVVSNGNLLGVLSRGNLLQIIRNRSELKAS